MEILVLGGLLVAFAWFWSRRKPSAAAERPATVDRVPTTEPSNVTSSPVGAESMAASPTAAAANPKPIGGPTPAGAPAIFTARHAPPDRFVVLDFETTGLSPERGARVIEVSAREFVGGRSGREILTFIDPGVPIPSDIVRLTGITNAMVRGAPRPAEVMREVAAFVGDAPIVGHNVAFDRKFLVAEARSFLPRQGPRTLCTLLLARRLLPGRASYKLGGLVDEIGIERPPQRLHRASADTWVTSQLFDHLCGQARRSCPRDVDHDLLDALQRIDVALALRWLGRRNADGAVASGHP